MARPVRSTTIRKAGQRAKRRANVQMIVYSLLLVILGVALTVFLSTSPAFCIKRTVVVGARTVPAAQIVAALGLSPDSNIFLIKKRDLTARVLKNPVIKNVILFRRIPSTLTVRVSERRTDLVLATGGALYDVDDAGVPFRLAAKPEPDRTVISCTLKGRVVLGRRLSDPGFIGARSSLMFSRRHIGLSVKSIAVDRNSELCLNVLDGLLIRLGRIEELSKKIDKAAEMIQEFSDLRTRGKYIDVSCPDVPAVKYKD